MEDDTLRKGMEKLFIMPFLIEVLRREENEDMLFFRYRFSTH
jgi:hypothetical protein